MTDSLLQHLLPLLLHHPAQVQPQYRQGQGWETTGPFDDTSVAELKEPASVPFCLFRYAPLRDFTVLSLRSRRVLRLPNRLLKNTHLLRCAHPSSLRRTIKYASFRVILRALHLNVFDQPVKYDFFNNPLYIPQSEICILQSHAIDGASELWPDQLAAVLQTADTP
jgi:hypothetical protein